MAKIRFFNNCFEDQYDEEEYDYSKPLSEQIKTHCNTSYSSEYVECYDPEEDRTFYAPLVDSDEELCAVITVDGLSVKEDYEVQEADILNVVYLPMGSGNGYNTFASIFQGFAIGATMGIAAGAMVGGFWGAIIGLAVGGVIGGFLGYYNYTEGLSSTSYTDKGSSLPDVRGSENQSLLNEPYPFVIGKHLVAPRIIADSYTTYSGTNGKDAIERIVYCVGYGPLKLTDFKLDEFLLAYNGTRNNKPNYISGLLKGCVEDDEDSGDILNRWKNNDISLEILQHNPNDSEVNYGTIYPNKVVQKEIKANVLYVADDNLSENAAKVYKGTTFAETFRTNGVWFTESCPMEFTINLNAPAGLYSSYTEDSEQKYGSIPLWFAIQWRPYDKNNPASDPTGKDSYLWNNIFTFNNKSYEQIYKYSGSYQNYFIEDLDAHEGNTFTDSSDRTVSSVENLVSREEDSRALHLVAENASSCTSSVSNFKILSDGVAIGSNYIYKGNPSEASDRYIVGRLCEAGTQYSALYDTETQQLIFDECPDNLTSYVCGEITVTKKMSYEYVSCNLYGAVKLNQYGSAGSTQSIKVKEYKLRRRYYLTGKDSYNKIAGYWIGNSLCNFQPLSGFKDSDHDGTGQIRLSATVTLSSTEMEQMLFSSNTIKGIEIRVVRVSPNYFDQTSGDNPKSYSDAIVVDSIVTKSFDEAKYYETGEFTPVKIQSEEYMKKFCYVAIEAKADALGNISSQLKKLSCTAEAFAPVWNDHKWLPEGVSRVTEYYGYYTDSTKTTKCDRTSSAYEVLLGTDNDAKKAYEEARGEGYSWLAVETGSNFTDKIKQIVFPSDGSQRVTHNDLNADILSTEATLYNDATAASGFMLAAVGNHNGSFALGYENIDTLSVSECYEAQQKVTDGSTYSYDDGSHNKGDTVEMKFEANGYVYQQTKLEDLLAKIATAGRCVYTYDDLGRIKLIMDKPVDYVKGVINEQNVISQTNSYTYETLPAGLRIQFPDEDDGYETNTLYCWADGNSIDKYRGNVESYSLDFVTNHNQAWSLGRYYQANKELNREVLNAKIGIEGNTFSLGDVVLVNNSELLIGDGSGRIREVIKDNDLIYGFIMDSFYTFKGETEDGLCTKGVQILHPKKYGEARVDTLRFALPGTTYTVGDTVYIFAKGKTNLILFNDPITITDFVSFNEDDIVMFGDYSKISTKYRIIKVKPDKDTFTYTLIQYTEDLFNYGAALPAFQSHMTIPLPSSDGVTLSETATTIKEENEAAVRNQAQLQAQISNLYASHTVYLYKKSNTPLTSEDLPTVVPTYNFKTDKLSYDGTDWDESESNNGWYTKKELTDEGDGEVYMTAATARGQSETDDIETSEWAAPVPYGSNGTDGVSTYTIVLYQRSDVQPESYPSGVSYNFETAEISGDLKNWETSFPRINSEINSVWEIHATAFGTDTEVSVDNWSTSKQISQDTEVTLTQIKEIINESMVTPSPTVYSDITFIGVQTDGMSVATVEQTMLVTYTVLQTGDELDFTFGNIDLPSGWSVEQIGRSLKFTISAGTIVKSGNINVEIIFRPYLSNYLFVNDKDEPEESNIYGNGTDESSLPYGQAIYDTESTTFNLSLGYTQVKGGRYLGPVSSESDIPSDLIVGDYFTWTGESTDTFKQTALYAWNGEKWSVDTSTEHAAGALSDVLSAGSDVLAENNSIVNTLLNRLTANEAFIGKLIVTGSAFIKALSTFEIVMGDETATGSIHSYGYIKGSTGWYIGGDGEAEFNNLTVRGAITATSLTLEQTAQDELETILTDTLKYAKKSDIKNYIIDAAMTKSSISVILYKNGEVCTESLYILVQYIDTEDGSTYKTDTANSKVISEWSLVKLAYSGTRYRVKLEIYDSSEKNICYASTFLSLGLTGATGASVYITDLSNEMDSVGLTSEGKTDKAYSLTTNPSMYYGTTQLTVTGIEASAVSGITPSYNKTTNTITVAVDKDVSVSKLTFPITVKATHNGTEVTGSVTFTVQGVKAGTDGTDGKNAVVYSLNPSVTSVSKDKNGNYSVSSVSCSVLKTDGESQSVVTSGYTLKYYLNGSSSGSTYSKAISTSTFTKLKFELTVSGVVVDTETINLTVDGTDGANGSSVYFADIDNEMDSVGLTKDGLTDNSYTLYTTPSMYYGTTQLTITGIKKNTVSDITPYFENGKIIVEIPSDKSFTKLVFPITLYATHNGNTVEGSVSFTVQGVKAGATGAQGEQGIQGEQGEKGDTGDNAVLYSLNPSVSSVTKYKDGSYSVSGVTCEVIRTDGSKSEVVTSGYTIKYYINGSSTAKTYSGSISTSSFTTLKLNLIVNTVIVDTETINVVSDGTDGADGKYMSYKFAIGDYEMTDEELAKLDWSDNPIPVTEEKPYLWMRTEWKE